MDPYYVRFAFFWYNDEEIFHDSQEEINAKIKKYADQGITHLITFTCTHFRWNFEPWWGILNECLAKIVKAAHQYGLKVIEHHSAELASMPDTPEHLAFLKRMLKFRKSSIESWEGLVEKQLEKDSFARRWVQIEEKTLKPHVREYAATCKCYNVPEYQQAYLKYLESIYATGVDGIMTDDVQYYCFCCCEHCRKAFKEQYGYELPSPEKWDDWFGNMSDPSFIAFLRFRFDSTHRFHQLVKDHYDKLGLKLLRPAYLSYAITFDRTAFDVEGVPEMHWFFQEFAQSCLIRYSWMKSLSEQTHRRMVAQIRNVPSGLLCYAYNQEELLFSWALAMLAGGFYINTPEGGEPVDETVIRNFEKQHASRLFHADQMTEVGFLDSRDNRYFSPGYLMSRMEVWIQTCILNNIPCAMVSAGHPETWKCRILCVNEVNMLSLRQINVLKQYAENGGILIFSGIPGNQDTDSSVRTRSECEKLWGITFDAIHKEKPETFLCGKGRICVVPSFFGWPGTREDVKILFEQDHMNFRYSGQPYDLLRSERFFCINNRVGTETRLPSAAGELYQGLLKVSPEICGLFRLLSRQEFEAEVPEGILAVPYRSQQENSVTIRLLNAAGTLIPDHENGTVMAANDPIPWHPWKGPDGKFILRHSGQVFRTAEFLDEKGNSSRLDMKRQEEAWEIILPAGMLTKFGMILLRE